MPKNEKINDDGSALSKKIGPLSVTNFFKTTNESEILFDRKNTHEKQVSKKVMSI